MKTKQQKRMSYLWILWYSLALNVMLIGAAMNLLVVQSNAMKMPVLLNDHFDSNYTGEYSNDPGLIKHKLYFNLSDYANSNLYILGDIIHINTAHRDAWYSLGDIYIMMGTVCVAGIFFARLGLLIIFLITKKKRYKLW